MRFTRQEIVGRLRDTITQRRPVIGAGCSAGLIAKSAEAGGADVIVVYSTGKSRLMGLPTTRLGDANRITVEMADEILNVTSKTPIVGGIDATDPTRWDLSKTLVRYLEAGFDGIINFPTISIFDDWRRRGDQVGLGFDREVELIKIAHDRDVFTMAYVAQPEDAAQMARAGVDCIVTHFGPTTGGMAGYRSNVTPAELVGRMQKIMQAAVSERTDVICLAHGGSIAVPEDTRPLYEGTHCVGFVGASSIERIPVEEAVVQTVKAFKEIPLGHNEAYAPAVAQRPVFRAMHTAFTVSSLDCSVKFYRDLLGFELLAERIIEGTHTETLTGIPNARIRLAFMRMPGHILELLEYLEPEGARQPTRTCDVGNGHICFEVADMQRAHRFLSEHDVRFTSNPLPIQGGPNDGGYVVYFQDPDGICLELIQRPKGAPPLGASSASASIA